MKTIEKVKYIFDQIRGINDEPSARAGLPESEILNSFQTIGLRPPSDIVDLYKWHNGIDNLNAFTHFLSLDDAVTIYKGYKELKRELPAFGWKRNWFPILDTNGDIQHCVDVETAAVIAIDLECDSMDTISTHYEIYLDALIYGFKKNRFVFNDASGAIETDEHSWSEVSNRFNIQ